MKKSTVSDATVPVVDSRCGTCLHCKCRFIDEDSQHKGVCFRNPPTPLFRPYAGSGAMPTFVRPIVKAEDAACGEWKARA
jgi:hypothetical protein